MLNVNTRFAIIRGFSDCGKSTSIILFIRELVETDEFRFICNRDSQRFHTILNSLDLNKKTKDLQCSILYKNKLIYITTFGDDATELNKRFCEHNGYADIIVAPADLMTIDIKNFKSYTKIGVFKTWIAL